MPNNLAMVSKTKAIFAKRLKFKDYTNLISKKNLVEIVTYLKNETYYHEVLNGVNEKAIRRGQLEVLIRNDLIYNLSKILNYANDIKHSIYQVFIVQSEIQLIMSLVRSFILQEEIKIVKLPIIIEHQLCFNLKEVANAKNYQELLSFMVNTPYHPIMFKYAKQNLKEFNFVAFEFELFNYYNDVVQNKLKKYNSNKAKILKNIFDADNELRNIGKIYRLKKYFKADKHQIRSLIHPTYYRFKKSEYDQMIEEDSPLDIIERIKKSNYKLFITNRFEEEESIESITSEIIYNINKKQIYFSNDADVIVTVFYTLAKVEIQNIVDIIEGVRYGLNVDEIKKMLIY